MTMNKKIKKLWVKALRSGKYEQTKGALRRGDGYCCLGVLCALHARSTKKAGPREDGLYRGNPALPDNGVVVWAGLPESNPTVRGNSLAYLNDHGKSFPEIADLIEAEL